MTLKKIVGIALLSFPVLGFANSDLTLVNDTNQDSTSIINDGSCSTILGTGGVTKAHTTNVISSLKVRIACWADSTNCKADVYMTDNCTGPKVATVTLDTSKGIKTVQMHTTTYKIVGSGFKVTLSGGPKD